MLNSVLPRHWEAKRQNWELPACLQITVATRIPRIFLTTVAAEVLRDACEARLSNVCLEDAQDTAGLQTCYLSSPSLGNGKKWKCGVPYSHMSARL